jgi:hypothetical protein
LFNKAEENRDNDGSFEGLAEDYEEYGDRKNVSGHGEGKRAGRAWESALGVEGSRQYKGLTNLN